MYLGIDVGGTKTLVGVLNDDGTITEQIKFATPGDYSEFLEKVRETVASFTTKEFQAAGIGVPGVLDRTHSIVRSFGNLPWRNVHIQADIEKIGACPTVINNDAKMAGLSEALLLKAEFKRVLYITVSTGIGIAFVNDGIIDDNLADPGGRSLLVEHRGKLVPWESFASGKAIFKRYGKPAHEIEDEEAWKTISRDLTRGLMELIALTEPEVIVFGGGVGSSFHKFKSYMEADLKKLETPLVKTPELREAKRPEEAVVYGCYDLAKATYEHAR